MYNSQFQPVTSILLVLLHFQKTFETRLRLSEKASVRLRDRRHKGRWLRKSTEAAHEGQYTYDVRKILNPLLHIQRN